MEEVEVWARWWGLRAGVRYAEPLYATQGSMRLAALAHGHDRIAELPLIAPGRGRMTPKQRAQTALAGGKPDRVPFVPEVDYDYIAKAAGREPWEFSYADGEERARMHEAFFLRHPCDVWPCWSSPSQRRLAQREIVREGDAVYYLDKRTGRRYRIDRRGELLNDRGEIVILGDDGEEIDEKSAAIWVAGGPYPRAVESEADIEELLGPVRPPSDWIEDGFFSTLQYLQPRTATTHLLAFCLNTIFADVLDLFGGFQEGLIALYTKRGPDAQGAGGDRGPAQDAPRRPARAIGAQCTWMIEYCAGADTISRAMYRSSSCPTSRRSPARRTASASRSTCGSWATRCPCCPTWPASRWTASTPSRAARATTSTWSRCAARWATACA